MNKEKEGRIWKAIFEKRSKKKQETIVSQEPYRRWVLRKKEDGREDGSQWNFGREARMSLKPAYGLTGRIWRKALQMQEQPKQDFRGGGCGGAKGSRRSGHHLSSAQQWSHPLLPRDVSPSQHAEKYSFACTSLPPSSPSVWKMCLFSWTDSISVYGK